MSVPPTSQRRRYYVHRLLGAGGFGRVYQATRLGADGASEVVALKLVAPEHADAINLSDLRHEARLGAAVRDPSVVILEEPFLLAGRWAVEMSFADGASLDRILAEHGRVPPRPAVLLVRDVLQALHRLVHRPAGDGLLCFMHRDLKPGNLQLTPSGEVLMLDLGNAVVRGINPTRFIPPGEVAGTRGYVAPERRRGQERPEGDVYSMGVVLFRLVTGRRPDQIDAVDDDGDIAQVLNVSAWMRQPDPEERPDAGQAAERLSELAATLAGPDLGKWTRSVRPVPQGLPPDDLVGQTLVETEHEIPLVEGAKRVRSVVPSVVPASEPLAPLPGPGEIDVPRPISWRLWLAIGFVVALFGVTAFLSLTTLLLMLLLLG